MTQMVNVLAIVIMLLMALAAFALYRFMFIRGLRQAVAIFRECGALDAERARSLEDLGLQTQPLARRLFRPRNYKVQAADLLFRQGVIQATPQGHFYLSETALLQSPLKRFFSQS
jgi:hypothetical protein